MPYEMTSSDACMVAYRRRGVPHGLLCAYSRHGEIVKSACADPAGLLPCGLRDLVARDLRLPGPRYDKLRLLIAASAVEAMFRRGDFSGVAGAAEDAKFLWFAPPWSPGALDSTSIY